MENMLLNTVNEQGHQRVLCSLRENNEKMKRECFTWSETQGAVKWFKIHNLSCVVTELEGEGITKTFIKGENTQHTHNEAYEHWERGKTKIPRRNTKDSQFCRNKNTHTTMLKKKKKRHTHSQTLRVHSHTYTQSPLQWNCWWETPVSGP